MREDSGRGYDSIPFRGRPVPWASPAALGLTSLAHGGPALDPTRPTRVLELGCGDGAHLVPLAAFRPHVTCVGIDVSASALAVARDAATTLGLTNASFELADVAHLEPPAEPYDVVVAHGVYSWIDAERRAALRRVAARSVRDGGLVYVSFNAEPGWSVRGRVRDALVRARPASLDAARARLAALRGLLPDEPQDAWSYLLVHELERAAEATDGYLEHEYLAADNACFWLGDVVRAFEPEGLRYVGEATFDRAEGFVDPSLRQLAAALDGDELAREEWLDLRGFRQLRCAVFAKTASVDAPPPRAAVVERAWVAGAVARRNDPFDLQQGAEEVFDGPMGRELRIRSATVKVALLLLADRWPRGTRLDALHAECVERLDELGIEAEPATKLAETLGALHEELQVELRLEDGEVRTVASERPTALPLTRHEAASRDVLTTPFHGMVPIEPIDRAIIARLDGTRSREALCAELTEDILRGAIEIGGAPSGAARVGAFLEVRLDATLTTLGWWGLVR